MFPQIWTNWSLIEVLRRCFSRDISAYFEQGVDVIKSKQLCWKAENVKSRCEFITAKAEYVW